LFVNEIRSGTSGYRQETVIQWYHDWMDSVSSINIVIRGAQYKF